MFTPFCAFVQIDKKHIFKLLAQDGVFNKFPTLPNIGFYVVMIVLRIGREYFGVN